MATLGATPLEHTTSAGRRHPGEEPVGPLSPPIAGLVGTFHLYLSIAIAACAGNSTVPGCGPAQRSRAPSGPNGNSLRSTLESLPGLRRVTNPAPPPSNHTPPSP